MRMSTSVALALLICTAAACSGGFGLRSSSSPNPAPAAAPAVAAPAAPAPAAPAPAAAAVPASATSPNPTYYKVTDVSSGKSFYTQKVNRSGSAVVFTDEKTGAETSLQSWQVLPVQKMEYSAGIAPTPAAAPVNDAK